MIAESIFVSLNIFMERNGRATFSVFMSTDGCSMALCNCPCKLKAWWKNTVIKIF